VRWIVIVALLSALAAPAWAVRAEQARIDALLAAVETSGCRFERNGTAYAAAEGAAHLRSKLDTAGDRVQTAVQFIERVASASSQSGKPYRVLCPDKPVQTSRQWLETRLAELIATGR
jgi:Tfp pilus assembly protein PilE